MTYIVFSFDTEDYVNPQAADGILNCANILKDEGVRGCFNIVGKLAEALVKWGRQDIIDALKYHEIDLHSYAHSWHPTINEYTDIEDFEEAKSRFFDNEKKARAITSDIFGVDYFPAACPPGASTSYVAHYGYAEMGVPIYCGDDLQDAVRGRNVWSCNILSTDYHLYLDRYLIGATKDVLDAKFESVAAEKDVYVLAHHPQMAIIDEFCDIVNFFGKNTPEAEWKLSKPKTKEDTAKFYENFTYLVKKIKADPRFKIVTYSELADMYCKDKRTLKIEEIPGINAQLNELFFPVTTPDSYCITDIFLACRDFLLGKASHECGFVYGFLNTPYAVDKEITVTAEEMKESAKAIADVGNYFLPEKFTVGSYDVGPADWLRAALEILCGADKTVIKPASWQIDMDQFPKVRDLNLKGSWVHSESFEDKYITDRFRLQSWTYRLAKGTKRTIY